LRRIIASEMVTLDGFFSGPNGELDWFVQDEELDRFAQHLLDSVDTIVYGRVTYQMMAGYWPHATGSFADRTNRLPKLVFSSTLDATPWGDWDNARPVNGPLADEVAKLKNEPGADIVIYGSGSVVRALTQIGAIDEYRLLVNPVVLGAGRPLFGGLAERRNLRLTESLSWPSGCVALTYQRIDLPEARRGDAETARG
jgi:dihydrofolate reductase